MKRILCLDYGDRKIGVSASDLLGITAQGVGVIFHKGGSDLFQELDLLVHKLNVSKIVVGLPKNMDGSIGFRGEKTLEFAKKLEERFKDIPIVTWDERLSTISAKKVMVETKVKSKKKKNVEDKLAASFILQSFLDSIN
jgi:putative Holliday junction resolvase